MRFFMRAYDRNISRLCVDWIEHFRFNFEEMWGFSKYILVYVYLVLLELNFDRCPVNYESVRILSFL